MKSSLTNTDYQNNYQKNNSCPITDVILSYAETSRRLGDWNLMKENI